MSACCLTRDISVSAHISHPISLISSRLLKKCLCISFGASLLAQWWRVCLPMKQMWAGSLGQEDPLEEEIATHSSVPSRRIPWTEEPGGLQSLGWQRVGYDLLTKQPQQQWIYLFGFAGSQLQHVVSVGSLLQVREVFLLHWGLVSSAVACRVFQLPDAGSSVPHGDCAWVPCFES